MKALQMTKEAAPKIAKMMCTRKPEWWDYQGAYGQLTDIGEAIKTVGWYLEDENGAAKGFLLCRELLCYRALEVECSGYDDNGTFKLEHKLGELFELAEQYAREKGYLTFRSGISSVGFNIHGRQIADIAEAISTLQCDRIDYQWYLEHGFRVIGIQPNAYDVGSHLILLGKGLV